MPIPPPDYVRLTDESELLFRQVHPSWLNNGRPSSQTFRPSAKDEHLLSAARSAMTTAEDAFRLHTEGRKQDSVGTWGVTVDECRRQALPCFQSPTTCPPEIVADPAHAHVDFTVLPSKGKREAAAILLTKFAIERGCLFSPNE
jgi:hypothetical protein